MGFNSLMLEGVYTEIQLFCDACQGYPEYISEGGETSRIAFDY